MKPKTKNWILYLSFTVLLNLFLWLVIIDSIVTIESITRFILILFSAMVFAAVYIWRFEDKIIDKFEIKESKRYYK